MAFACLRILLTACWFLVWPVWAAETSTEIPEAPLSDDTLPSVPPSETKPQSDSSAILSGVDHRGVNHRVYWIASYEFSPEKTASSAMPLSLPGSQTQMRSSRLEMNGEFSKRFSDRLFLKLDLQADYYPHYDEDDCGKIRLNELFFEYRPFPGLSFLAGKYRRVFGPGLFQNPMDRHTPAAFLPGQPLQREGAYQLQATWTSPYATAWLSDAVITAAFLPGLFIDNYGLPTRTIDFSQIAGMGQIRTNSESWSKKRLGGFLRGYGNLARGDANVMLYYYESQWQLGASYSRYVVSPWLEAHAEGLHYCHPHDRQELGESSYWDGVIGIRVEPWSMSGLIVEWLHYSERMQKVPATLAEQQQMFNNFLKPETHLTAAMPFRDYFVLTAFGQPWKDRLTVRGNAIVHPKCEDALWMLRGDLALGDHTQLSLTGMLITASSNGFYKTAIPFPWRLAAELWIYL